MQWPRPAADDLAEDVLCTWTAEMTLEELLVPDGCVDIVWLDTGEAIVCGPERRAWRSPRPFGPEIAVPDHASPQDKLPGFLGRRPERDAYPTRRSDPGVSVSSVG